MSQAPGKAARSTAEPEPAWDIAYLFPPQGCWSEEEYLALDTNRLVEFSNGVLAVLPMPTTSHQLLAFYLAGLLAAFVTGQSLGTVLPAPLRVRLRRGQYREPDVVFMRREHSSRIGEKFWKGADLVMEVVSEGKEDRHRDYVIKRREYARAGIPEYWIVDPQEEKFLVLRLAGKRYVVHGEFGKGAIATSHLLPGFSVDVTQALTQPAPQARRGRKPKR